jgi:hypothetical protein
MQGKGEPLPLQPIPKTKTNNKNQNQQQNQGRLHRGLDTPGYYQYDAVPGNTGQLRVFRRRVCRVWRSVLVRRSQRAQVGWDRLNPLLNRWIPAPHVLHPYPDKRFDALHPQ